MYRGLENISIGGTDLGCAQNILLKDDQQIEFKSSHLGFEYIKKLDWNNFRSCKYLNLCGARNLTELDIDSIPDLIALVIMYSGIKHAELTTLQHLQVVVYGWCGDDNDDESDNDVDDEQTVSCNAGVILRRFNSGGNEIK